MINLPEHTYSSKENQILQFENHANYNCEITTDAGNTFRIYANWMHNHALDSWSGWHCHTGSTRLYVDKNLNVYNGECQVQHLGHALQGFDMVAHTVCTRSTCTGCTDDLITKKYAPR